MIVLDNFNSYPIKMHYFCYQKNFDSIRILWTKSCILFYLHHCAQYAPQVWSCYSCIPPPSIPLLRSLLFSRTFPYLVTIIALCGHSLLLIPVLSPFKCSHGGLFTFALVGNFKEVRFLNPFLIEFIIGTSDVK